MVISFHFFLQQSSNLDASALRFGSKLMQNWYRIRKRSGMCQNLPRKEKESERKTQRRQVWRSTTNGEETTSKRLTKAIANQDENDDSIERVKMTNENKQRGGAIARESRKIIILTPILWPRL
jgi:hypothetical protein